MHAAGIAQAIITTIEQQRKEGQRVRISVRGGRTDPHDFDVALGFHLCMAAPQLDPSIFEIVHVPGERTCATCSESFVALGDSDTCPICGGSAWPEYGSEEIDVEFIEAQEWAVESRPDVIVGSDAGSSG